MADLTFNTTDGVTIAREKLALYLNTGTTATPVWSPVGKRVEDSSIELDWSLETKVDIFGDTYTTGKKATRTQSFDPWELDASEAAQELIWNKAFHDNDVTALLAQDCLLVHFYAGTTNFAERFESCSVTPTGLGGEGGGSIGMPIDVTYGGKRTTGSVTVSSGGVVTFTADV